MVNAMLAQSRSTAVSKVDRHVSPKECFVWYMNNARGYEPIEGTGCAHYVAHQLGMRSGHSSSNGCDHGYLIRVADVVRGKGWVPATEVQVNDVWASDDLAHCGVVTGIAAGDDGQPLITITHCSSRDGGVFASDWKLRFRGGGRFYR